MLEDLKKLRTPGKGFKTIVKKETECDNCKETEGFYLGITCPKCNKPFRIIKEENKPIRDDNSLFPKEKRGKYKTKNNEKTNKKKN